MSGVFTPTESACVAVVYGLIVGFFIYRELTLKDIVPIFYRSALSSGMIMLLIGVANPFGWILTAKQAPAAVSNALLSVSSNPSVIYLLVLVLYIILGCFMETSAIILLVVPIVAPIMQSIGVDMIQFGVITVISLAIGMITPPVGVSLFVACGIGDVNIKQITVKIIPFLVTLIVGMYILAYIPALTTFLPKLLMP